MASFYSYILVICFISRCRELVDYNSRPKLSLTHSIHHTQFLDFVLSEIDEASREHQSSTFFKGTWQLSFSSNDYIISNEKLDHRFTRNSGKAHVRFSEGLPQQVWLLDGHYQDRMVRLTFDLQKEQQFSSATFELFDDFQTISEQQCTFNVSKTKLTSQDCLPK